MLKKKSITKNNKSTYKIGEYTFLSDKIKLEYKIDKVFENQNLAIVTLPNEKVWVIDLRTLILLPKPKELKEYPDKIVIGEQSEGIFGILYKNKNYFNKYINGAYLDRKGNFIPIRDGNEIVNIVHNKIITNLKPFKEGFGVIIVKDDNVDYKSTAIIAGTNYINKSDIDNIPDFLKEEYEDIKIQTGGILVCETKGKNGYKIFNKEGKQLKIKVDSAGKYKNKYLVTFSGIYLDKTEDIGVVVFPRIEIESFNKLSNKTWYFNKKTLEFLGAKDLKEIESIYTIYNLDYAYPFKKGVGLLKGYEKKKLNILEKIFEDKEENNVWLWADEDGVDEDYMYKDSFDETSNKLVLYTIDIKGNISKVKNLYFDKIQEKDLNLKGNKYYTENNIEAVGNIGFITTNIIQLSIYKPKIKNLLKKAINEYSKVKEQYILFFDRDTKQFIPGGNNSNLRYKRGKIFPFNEKFLGVGKDVDKWWFIDKNGKLLGNYLKTPWMNEIDGFYGKIAKIGKQIRKKDDNIVKKYWFIDTNGKILFGLHPKNWMDIIEGPTKDGYYIIGKEIDGYYKYWFIDKDGNVVGGKEKLYNYDNWFDGFANTDINYGYGLTVYFLNNNCLDNVNNGAKKGKLFITDILIVWEKDKNNKIPNPYRDYGKNKFDRFNFIDKEGNLLLKEWQGISNSKENIDVLEYWIRKGGFGKKNLIYKLLVDKKYVIVTTSINE